MSAGSSSGVVAKEQVGAVAYPKFLAVGKFLQQCKIWTWILPFWKHLRAKLKLSAS